MATIKLPPAKDLNKAVQALRKTYLSLSKETVKESLTLPAGIIAPAHNFQNLMIRYNETHRFYHTQIHIFNCFVELNKFMVETKAPTDHALLVSWALFYHDAVYNVPGKSAGSNEVDSAKMFFNQPGTNFKTNMKETVAEAIVATTSHTVDTNNLNSRRAVAAITCDIDLSILGKEPAVYLEYVDHTRQEWAFVTDEQWVIGRRRFLGGMLERRRIFHTQYFADLYAVQARHNMQAELDMLNGKFSDDLLPQIGQVK